MAKIVPIETRQSMLEEPSRGSKHTMYFPCQIKASHTIIIFIKARTLRTEREAYPFFGLHDDGLLVLL